MRRKGSCQKWSVYQSRWALYITEKGQNTHVIEIYCRIDWMKNQFVFILLFWLFFVVEYSPKIFETDSLYTEKSIIASRWIKSKFGLWLHFLDSFSTIQNSIWYEINRRSAITIQFWFNLTRFRSRFLCAYLIHNKYYSYIIKYIINYQKI